MTDYEITGNFRGVKNELVDYLADGYIVRGGDVIPCEVGLIEVHDWSSDEDRIQPTHIFIKDGITDNGTHYHAETIKL